jgi:hypothetical protein
MTSKFGFQDTQGTYLKPKVSSEEMARRRLIVRAADHENLLEGIVRSPETDAIFEAFIRGEIEATDIRPRIKAAIGLT